MFAKTPTIIATLKRSNKTKDGLVPVYIRYTINRKSFYLPTGVKILPELWEYDKRPKTPISKRFGKGHSVLNRIIRQTIIDAHKIIADQKRQSSDNPTTSKQAAKIEETDSLFLHTMRRFIDYQGTILKPNTLKGYHDLYAKIKKFSPSVTLLEINQDFYTRLIGYLGNAKLANSSIGKLIKNLKVIMRWAEVYGSKVSPDYRSFKVFRPKKTIIYLTQDELKAILRLEIIGNETMDRVRDLFVFQCRTGLRISDLKRVDKSHIENGFIKMDAYKNNNQILIKITPLTERILVKYNYRLPLLSDQYYNRYIKKLCDLAGINTLIDQRLPSGKIIKVPKYKLISNHNAVKTFITHCGERGVSPKVTAQITGKTVKVILDHYYGSDLKVIDRDMMNAFGDEI